MKKLCFLIFCITGLISQTVSAVNAPITTVTTIINATTVPGGVIAPVTVKNFINIGSFTLTLKFDTSVIKFVSAATHPSFTGMSVVYSVECSKGKLVISWTGASGITLPDLTHLLDLTFTYVKGSTTVSWGWSNRVGWCSVSCTCMCQYFQYAGSSLVLCTASPPESYFIDGGVSNRSAPVTIADVIGNAVTGNYDLPVKVNGFTGIAAISLELAYDSTILSFTGGFTPNAALPGFNVGSNPGSGTTKIMSMGWIALGGSASLPDGSTMVSLNFNYSNTNGGYSTLNWFENGPSCDYADSAYYTLIDFPTSDYYKNGIIYSSGHFAPQVFLPSNTSASPGPLAVPVEVNNFKDVKSFTLSFLYDPAVMTYNSGFVQNPALTGSFTVNDLLSTNGKRKLVMSWTGTGLVDLPNGSTAVTLNFTYISGASSLSWKTDSSFCRFNDGSGNAYYDLPKSNYYNDGVITSHAAPVTAAWYASGTIGNPVTVPVKVYHYTNIGFFNLTMEYDPAVLTYQSAALLPPLGGTFTASTQGLGKLRLHWTGTASSLPDSTNLINLTFIYNGGSTPLAWFTPDTSCKYAEGAVLPALYDLPKSNYYINGNIGPNPVIANFGVSNTTPGINDTVTFTDLSSGSPDNWNWSISPSTYMFVNGTSSSSPDPQVSFFVNGAYTVTLIASNGISSNIKIKPVYIHVGTPGLWTGLTSTDWTTGSNWHNYSVPVSSVNVFIPSSAPNWPLFTGDLTMGTQCKNITLDGTSQLTVTGNFTINGGTTLSFTGSATLYVGANWSDSGTFSTGTGTVEFFGSSPASILIPSNETFYNLIENKTSATLTVPHTVVVNGKLTLK